MGTPCGWEITNCGCGKCWDTYAPSIQAAATALAAGLMWAATGRRYGLCDITIQPCNPLQGGTDYRVYPAIYDSWGGGESGLLGPYIDVEGTWRNAYCGSSCGCATRQGCQIELAGPTTKERISQVTVAGDVVDPDAYVVFDGYLLTRVDGQCWPTCNLPTNQSPPGFTVAYSRGDPIPPAIQVAFETVGCEFAKACAGGNCRLPTRLSNLSRQGVEVDVADISTAWAAMMRTNIPLVDQAIAADNPGQLRQRPEVFSPDLPAPRMLT